MYCQGSVGISAPQVTCALTNDPFGTRFDPVRNLTVGMVRDEGLGDISSAVLNNFSFDWSHSRLGTGSILVFMSLENISHYIISIILAIRFILRHKR